MSNKIKTALIGIGGYGDAYLAALLHDPKSAGAEFIAAVEPNPDRCRRMDELKARRIPIYPDIEELFKRAEVDLAMIVTPIHLHAAQTCLAMRSGAHVLCEKPLGGTMRDAYLMLETQHATGKFAAIGFQWSFSNAVQTLKADIARGLLGRPVRMRTLVFFPRPMSYFRRNDWAGRVMTASGQLVLDSPVNNATSHYLHNMFYLLGPSARSSAKLTSVQAELYRANDIENYDTASLRCRTEDGVEVLFYSTHAVASVRGPVLRCEFEDAAVEYDAANGGQFIARFSNGEIKNYGSPNVDRNEKIWQAIDAAGNGGKVACGIDAAMAHSQCVLASQQSTPEIVNFPSRLKNTTLIGDEQMICIDGLADTFIQCYERGILPSENSNTDWGRGGSVIDLRADEPQSARKHKVGAPA